MTARLALFSLLTFAGMLACARVPPQYVEPEWGDAPAPHVSEVTEVTLEYRHCGAISPQCTTQRVVFRRDGIAERVFVTGKTRDSSFAGSVDSAAFAGLVELLRREGHFRYSSGGRHEPLSVDSYLVSGATLCRRATRGYYQNDLPGSSTPEVPAAILEVANHVEWGKCCRRGLSTPRSTE